jgi:hypothetical protein
MDIWAKAKDLETAGSVNSRSGFRDGIYQSDLSTMIFGGDI